MKNQLTAAHVIELAQLRVKIADLNTQEEKLCNDLKDRMIERGIDVFAPSTIPLKLVKREYEQSKEGFYEAIAKRAYKKLHGPRWKIELEKEKDHWPKREVISLHVQAGNENYQQRLLEKVG